MVRLSHQSKEVLLPTPLEEEIISLPKTVKRSMNGAFISYKGKVTKSLNLRFSNCDRLKVLEVIEFLKQAKADWVSYIGTKEIVGRILNDPAEFPHLGRHNSTFTLRFECRDL